METDLARQRRQEVMFQVLPTIQYNGETIGPDSGRGVSMIEQLVKHETTGDHAPKNLTVG